MSVTCIRCIMAVTSLIQRDPTQRINIPSRAWREYMYMYMSCKQVTLKGLIVVVVVVAEGA